MKRKIIGLLTGILIASCNSNSTQENQNATDPKIVQSIKVPEFQQDSAYQWVAQQLSFGPRVPGTIEHQRCRDWLVSKLEAYGAKVYVQKAKIKTYNGKEIEISNIIAQFFVDKPKRIMLSAHWDTRPFADEDSIHSSKPILGANDGGSGVAVLLEIARNLSQQPAAVGVDIFLWDAEDMGNPEVENSYCLGSQHWTKNLYPTSYKAAYGINLDMVGAQNAQFPHEGVSLKYAKGILNKVWSTAHQIGYGNYFVFHETDPITDDHLYINQLTSIPTIDIIHKDLAKNSFFAQWHTHGDNLNIIDRNTLKAVGQTLLHVIYYESPEL